MNKIINIFKSFINVILKYLKSLLVIIFDFFFDLFNNDKINDELKAIKLDNTKENSDFNIFSNDAHHSEDATSRIIYDSKSLSSTDLELEKLISEIFCEELDIEENTLSDNEKKYIKTLNEKIISILKDDLDKSIITDKCILTDKVKKLVVEELKQQYKIEQKNVLPPDKNIILPIIEKKKIEKKEVSSKNILLSSLISLKEEKNDSVLNENVHDNTCITSINSNVLPEKKNDVFITSVEKTTEIPSNNLIGIVPPIKEDNNELIPESIENLYSPQSDDNLSEDYISDKQNDISFSYDSNNVISSFNDCLPLGNISPNKNEPDSTNTYIEPLEEVEDLKKDDENLEIFQDYDFQKIDNIIQNIIFNYNTEMKKEDIEDKNYDIIEKQIDSLLEKINNIKMKKLSALAKNKLASQESRLLQLKDSLNSRKAKDIEDELTVLDAIISNEQLNALENELEKIHIDNNIDLQNFMINRLEDLDNINSEKARSIEKELLKIKLKKAIHALELPTLLALPFIRNKYFMFFTGGLMVNRHLKFFDAILKRKSIDFEPEEISHVNAGSLAFNDALLMSKQNLNYLENLEMEAFRKYPELRLDMNYLFQINKLKTKLLKQHEKLLKKEMMFKKHNLKLKKQIRKLKKKENQNF